MSEYGRRFSARDLIIKGILVTSIAASDIACGGQGNPLHIELATNGQGQPALLVENISHGPNGQKIMDIDVFRPFFNSPTNFGIQKSNTHCVSDKANQVQCR